MQHLIINISGMTCGGCTSSVKNVLSAIPGVSKVDVSLERAHAEIAFDPEKTNEQAFNQAITAAGFEVT